MSLARFPYPEGEARVRTCDVDGCDRHAETCSVFRCAPCGEDRCYVHATCGDCADDRQGFEAHVASLGRRDLDLRRNAFDTDAYANREVAARWESWKARKAVTS